MENPADLLQGRTRETKIRRDAQGRWFNDGNPVDHPNLVRAFDGWIDRADDGRYCLRNDINWAYVTIEGPAYFVRSVDVRGGAVELSLSGDRCEPLDPETLRQGPDGALYCDVLEGRCVARFDNHAAAALGTILDEDSDGVFLRIGGRIVRPPVSLDPLSGRNDPA